MDLDDNAWILMKKKTWEDQNKFFLYGIGLGLIDWKGTVAPWYVLYWIQFRLLFYSIYPFYSFFAVIYLSEYYYAG